MWTPETLLDHLASPAMARMASTTPLSPAAPASAAGASQGFGALYGEVRDEVAGFIREGSTGFADDAPVLNAGGWLLRQQVQGSAGAASNTSAATGSADQAEFLGSIAPWARQAADRLGVDPDLIAAHAALESGWGRQPLRTPDGRDTHNLFSLKASPRWVGESASVATTEYEQGVAQARTEKFRSYADKADAFEDYTRLLRSSPRYQDVLNTGSDARAFAQALARGGYATDPAYADKLVQVSRQVKALGAVDRASAQSRNGRD